MSTHHTTGSRHLPSARTLAKCLAPVASLSLIAAGCGDYSHTPPTEWNPIDVEGSSSRVSFQTPDDTSETSYLQRKLAVNARMHIKPSRSLTSATSSDPTIFTADLQDPTILIEAKSEGAATLNVEFMGQADDSDMGADMAPATEIISDSLDIRTATAQRVELKNICDRSDKLSFLTGREDIFLGYELLDSAGEPLSGHGYYPFQAETNQKITLSESQHHELMMLTTLDQPGTINISSQLDATSWNLQLFDAGAIDGAMVHGNRVDLPNDIGLDGLLPYTRRFKGEDMYPNTIYAMHIEPTVQGSPLCMADLPVFVESITPDHCSIIPLGIDEETYESGDFEAHDESYGLIGISTQDLLGECKFTVTYPQGLNGQGVTTTITLPVIEPPQPVMDMPDLDTPEDMGYDSEDMPDSGIDMAPDMEQEPDLSPELDMDDVDMMPDMEEQVDMTADDADMGNATDMATDDADMP